jgi:hypothetical protein
MAYAINDYIEHACHLSSIFPFIVKSLIHIHLPRPFRDPNVVADKLTEIVIHIDMVKRLHRAHHLPVILVNVCKTITVCNTVRYDAVKLRRPAGISTVYTSRDGFLHVLVIVSNPENIFTWGRLTFNVATSNRGISTANLSPASDAS